MDQPIDMIKIRKGQIADVLVDFVVDGDRQRPQTA